MVASVVDQPKAKPTTVAEWHCKSCTRYLGRIIGVILHEPNGDRSVLPCIRHCQRCGQKNVRLQ